MIQSMDTLVGEIDRDTEACLFNEPALDLVDSLSMAAERIDEFGVLSSPLADSVELFVDIGDTVLPKLVLPVICRKRIFENAAISI